MTDLNLSCKSKTNNPIKRKTKGHVLLVVIDLFCFILDLFSVTMVSRDEFYTSCGHPLHSSPH